MGSISYNSKIHFLGKLVVLINNNKIRGERKIAIAKIPDALNYTVSVFQVVSIARTAIVMVVAIISKMSRSERRLLQRS